MILDLNYKAHEYFGLPQLILRKDMLNPTSYVPFFSTVLSCLAIARIYPVAL